MNKLLLFLLLIAYLPVKAESWQCFPFADQYRRVVCQGNDLYLLKGDRLFLADAPSWCIAHEFNRQNGLSATGIADIVYSASSQKLAIVFSNGLIDIYHPDGSFSSLADIKETPFEGQSKHINHVYEGFGTLCISTDFGFVAVDMNQEVILHSISLPKPIIRTWIDNSRYYCKMRGGQILSCPINANVYNPSNWISASASSTGSTLPPGAIDQCLSLTGDTIYTLYPEIGLVSNQHADTLTVGQYQQGGNNNRLHYRHGILAGCHVSDLTFYDYETNIKAKGYLTEYIANEDLWLNYDESALITKLPSRKKLTGLMDMIPHPSIPHRYYFSTLENGINVVQDGVVTTRWDNYEPAADVEAFANNSARVGGLAFSPQEDLWFINEGMDDLLRVRTHNGTWLKFPVNGAAGQVSMPRLIHTQQEGTTMLWGCRTAGYQKCIVFGYDYNGTVSDPSDDRSVTHLKFIDQDNRTIHPYYINNIVEAPDGAIWIMSTQGIFAIEHPDQAFGTSCQVRMIFDGLVANAIVFDADGRIWIGTPGDGIYLYDQTATRLIEHLTVENCLLSSNEILALSYDAAENTIWISCVGSILSYRTASLAFGTAYCYPSRVAAGSDAVVNVAGLADQSTVEVQDAMGNTISHLMAIGGTVSLETQSLDKGLFTIIGTDSQGHSGSICNFTIE